MPPVIAEAELLWSSWLSTLRSDPHRVSVHRASRRLVRCEGFWPFDEREDHAAQRFAASALSRLQENPASANSLSRTWWSPANSDSRLGYPSRPPQIVQRCCLSRLTQEVLWHFPHARPPDHGNARRDAPRDCMARREKDSNASCLRCFRLQKVTKTRNGQRIRTHLIGRRDL